MKPKIVVFVDETLEKSFNGINKDDPIKKALTKSDTIYKRRCFFWKKCKKETYSKRTY